MSYCLRKWTINVISQSLLRQFNKDFEELGVVTTGLELEDFVKYVDKPLQMFYKTNTNCSVDSRSKGIGDE